MEEMKLLVVGPEGVGKTSSVFRASQGFFTRLYHPTTTTDFALVDLGEGIGNVQLWDVPGNLLLAPEQRRRTLFYKADGVLALCDITRPGETLPEALDWCTEARRISPGIPIVLACNKVDMPTGPDMPTRKTLNRLCNVNGLSSWFFTSAKSGNGIRDAITKLCLNRIAGVQVPSVVADESTPLIIPESQQRRRGTCLCCYYCCSSKKKRRSSTSIGSVQWNP